MCLQMMCSSSLHGIDVNDSGLLFSAACLSPFLNTHVMFALSQSLGKDPVLMDFWYIEASPSASCFEHSLRILFGIPSCPDAFDGLSCFNHFSTPSGLIIIVGIVSLTCFVVFGSVVFCSLVNTDLHWRTCISIALLSFTSCPLVFRGATPMLSCFLDLIYFQNGFGLLFCSPSIIVL